MGNYGNYDNAKKANKLIGLFVRFRLGFDVPEQGHLDLTRPSNQFSKKRVIELHSRD